MDHPSSDNDTTGKQVVFWGREAPESGLSLRSRGPALLRVTLTGQGFPYLSLRGLKAQGLMCGFWPPSSPRLLVSPGHGAQSERGRAWDRGEIPGDRKSGAPATLALPRRLEVNTRL